MVKSIILDYLRNIKFKVKVISHTCYQGIKKIYNNSKLLRTKIQKHPLLKDNKEQS